MSTTDYAVYWWLSRRPVCVLRQTEPVRLPTPERGGSDGIEDLMNRCLARSGSHRVAVVELAPDVACVRG